jgi:predicted dehydrogenase
MKAEKHVLCNVPSAWTLEECQDLINTVECTEMKYMLAESVCYNPFITYVKKSYDADEMGEIFYYQGAYFHDLGGPDSNWDHFSQSVEPDGFQRDKKYTWRYGWAPFQYLEHNSAPIIWVLNQQMTEVTANGWGYNPDGFMERYGVKWSEPYNNPFTMETGLFRLEGGSLAKISICWVLAGHHYETQFWGTKRSFKTEKGENIVMSKYDSPKQLDKLSYSERLDPELQGLEVIMGSGKLKVENSAFIVQSFVKSIINDTNPPIDVYKAVSFTAPGICAHQSALEHRKVKIPNFGE